MSKERPFFKGSDTSFGIFYPTDYFIAVFDSPETAQRAEEKIRAAGYAEDDVDVVDSDYVRADIKKRVTDASWLDRLMQTFSVGSEACF
ncbi:MAG: hypothetical protein ACREVE_09215 [Gammaproteobacteria bacterium]